MAYDGYDIEELGEAEIESEFSNMDVKYLKKTFVARKFSYGSLGISRVDDHFSAIKVDAGFSKVKVALDAGCNFRATLYSSFGSIRTENVTFYEKTLDKKDATVGIVGKIKDPSATMSISNEYGGIVLQ
jgi:hypothetical protein